MSCERECGFPLDVEFAVSKDWDAKRKLTKYTFVLHICVTFTVFNNKQTRSHIVHLSNIGPNLFAFKSNQGSFLKSNTNV